jgi:hypothetical protein
MRTLYLIPALLLLLTSCKKDNSNDSSTVNCGKTVSDISGSYSLIKYEQAPSGGSFSEKPVPACMVGDKLILLSDGTTQYNDVGTSCGEQKVTGSWSISVDSKITIDAGLPFGYVGAADITTFDCTTLVITTTSNGEILRITLKK